MARHVDIEQVGTGGTSLGKFTRTAPVAVAEKVTDSYGYVMGYRIRSTASREVIGELFPAVNPGLYFAWNTDEIHGTRRSAADGSRTFMDAVAAILGKPGAGYTHYRKADCAK